MRYEEIRFLDSIRQWGITGEENIALPSGERSGWRDEQTAEKRALNGCMKKVEFKKKKKKKIYLSQ